MDQDQANLILDAMARTAIATDTLFSVLEERPEVLSDEQLAAVDEYMNAKLDFDNTLRLVASVPGAPQVRLAHELHPREVH